MGSVFHEFLDFCVGGLLDEGFGLPVYRLGFGAWGYCRVTGCMVWLTRCGNFESWPTVWRFDLREVLGMLLVSAWLHWRRCKEVCLRVYYGSEVVW